MSFLVDIVLIGILVAVATAFARKSVFSAGFGTLVTVVGIVAAVFLTPIAAPLAAEYTLAPLTERAVAEELADMYSAPHLATPDETVASLPLETMIAEQSEPYLQLLQKYYVEPSTVQAAWQAQPDGGALVRCIAAPICSAVSEGAVFLLLAVVLTVVLQLVVRRVEQNLPPQRRYRGIKRVLPLLFGVLCGLLWSWAATLVLSRVVPPAAEQLVFLTPAVLEATDWYRWLHSINPLTWL